MTMSSPASARPSRRLRRPRARMVTAALAAVLALASAPAIALPSAAWADVPAGVRADADVDVDGPPEERPITFAMAPSAAGVLTADTPLVVSVSAGNPTDATVAAGAVALATSATPLADRSAVQAWLASDGTAASRTEIALTGTEIPAITANGRAVSSVVPDVTPLAGLAPGVYPLRAQYESAQGPLTAVSVLVVRGDIGTGAAGVVVPITAPPISAGLLSSSQLATLTADDGDLRARLDAVAGTDAILAVDPAIVAAIRVLGTSAPLSATQWLSDLMALPNARFALQFGDADLATQVAASPGAPLAVPSLAPYMSASDFVGWDPTATPGPSAPPAPTPTPSATPAGPALPTLDELTDIGAAPGAVYWSATGTAGAEVAAALAGQTVDDIPSLTMLDSGALPDDPSTGAWAQAGDARVLIYDEVASAALRTAAESEAPVVRAGALAAASAYAALDAAAAPDAPLLFAVDRSTTFSAAALRETVVAAAQLTGRPPADLAMLTAGAPDSVTLDGVAPDSARATDLNVLLEDETTLTSFATILTDASVLTAPERASILQLLGNGWSDTPTAAQDAYDAHRAQTVKTLNAVAIQPPSDITLAATSAPLTFSVRNDLPWSVSLILIATGDDPRLRVQSTTPVEVGPSQNARVKVPVEARVGSGESTLDLQLRSPTMVPIGGAVPVHVAVRAEWESVGLIVGSILVAAMLVGGVIRTVLKIRRRKQGGDA